MDRVHSFLTLSELNGEPMEPAALIEAADRVMNEGSALRAHLEKRLPHLVATARRTTDLVSALVGNGGQAA